MQTPPQYRGFYIFVSHEKMTIVYLAIFHYLALHCLTGRVFFFFPFVLLLATDTTGIF